MELRFREVFPGDVEQELTQRDQFNTDSVPLAATLVRESIQNSTDARIDNTDQPTKIRIAYKKADPTQRDRMRALLEPLKEHLVACSIDVSGLNFSAPDFLAIEDFGTTGLTGEYDSKDDENFNDFWRRVGRSHKPGTKGGSWGLGKLVFPVSSEIRTFFGLTIRNNDPATQLLMGQTILTTHRLGGVDYVPHGFFARHQANGFQRPESSPGIISPLSSTFGFARKHEPGLSIAIPFPQEGLNVERLIPLIIENYFFPILTRQLEIDAGGERIGADTFDAVARKYQSSSLADGHLVLFIRDIQRSRAGPPTLVLPENWTATGIEEAIGEDILRAVREQYDSGHVIGVRLPMRLRQADNTLVRGNLDVFLRRASDDVPQSALKPLFIRGSITVPNEEANFRNKRAFGALVADENVSRFLRDAENPAHTSWNGNAEKLTKNWKAAALRLREIRRSMAQLHQLLDQAVPRLDADALKALIHLTDRTGARTGRSPDPIVRQPPFPQLTPSPKLFEITRRAGGFAIKSSGKPKNGKSPMRLGVQAAYDLPMGNPFKKHDRFDFDFRMGGDVRVSAAGATWSASDANRGVITCNQPEFSVEFAGFDGNRDLIISAVRLDNEASN